MKTLLRNSWLHFSWELLSQEEKAERDGYILEINCIPGLATFRPLSNDFRVTKASPCWEDWSWPYIIQAPGAWTVVRSLTSMQPQKPMSQVSPLHVPYLQTPVWTHHLDAKAFGGIKQPAILVLLYWARMTCLQSLTTSSNSEHLQLSLLAPFLSIILSPVPSTVPGIWKLLSKDWMNRNTHSTHVTIFNVLIKTQWVRTKM